MEIKENRLKEKHTIKVNEEGEYMARKVVIGKQDFAALRENDYFYVDKSDFIKEWWDSGDDVTLITRPRRFGKTLNMSMLNCFFSNQYADRGDLFEGLSIWKNDDYRKIQGTYPVIFLSFADLKSCSFNEARNTIAAIINDVYKQYRFLLDSDIMSDSEKSGWVRLENYAAGLLMNAEDNNALLQRAIKDLCGYLSRYYRRKVIILLDEYDTPMQEAYMYGYWDEFTAFMRNLFNSTFKTNPYLERAVMTGITRVSKESMFSDLNNLKVITVTSEEYNKYFGFTEGEVFEALEEMGLSSEKAAVKKWYDGFTFGSQRDIYNPWSIINYLDEKKLKPYWASTSSNGLVSRLLQTASSDMKMLMEKLLSGDTIVVNFDEQIVFNQLDTNESAVWSLLVAGGYLKVNAVEYRGELLEPWYHAAITNLETKSMFCNMFKGWFNANGSHYNRFVEALIKGNLKEMNIFMNDVAVSTFSYFDTGVRPSGNQHPERFYHGFMLGLISELRDIYEIKSNRESGYGRYDVMMIPKNTDDDRLHAVVLEFKVHEADEEKTLEDTAKKALSQIADKNYDAELIARGISQEKIRHYGFAFEGKKVLIMEDMQKA